MFKISSFPWLKLYFAALVGALFLLPDISHGQARQWEQFMELGDKAQATGDIYAAESYFRGALEIARQFPAQDLRRSTTQRNLAQILAVQGRHPEADTLYCSAIEIARLSLDDSHPYIVTLKNELEQLRQAVVEDESVEGESPLPGGSLAEFLFRFEKWLATNTSLHVGATLPIIGELQHSNEQGFCYSLGLRMLHLKLGPLSTSFRLEFNSSDLPAKHALDEPLKVEGPAAIVSPMIGPVAFSAGAGYYNVYASGERHPQTALLGGAGFEIWKKRRSGQTHLKLVINLRATQLTSPVADLAEAPIILQAMLSLRPR